MAVMLNVVVPKLDRVMVLPELVVPIARVEKVRLVGDKVAFGPDVNAALLDASVCGVTERSRGIR